MFSVLFPTHLVQNYFEQELTSLSAEINATWQEFAEFYSKANRADIEVDDVQNTVYLSDASWVDLIPGPGDDRFDYDNNKLEVDLRYSCVDGQAVIDVDFKMVKD
jgi:hypothetical protein